MKLKGMHWRGFHGHCETESHRTFRSAEIDRENCYGTVTGMALLVPQSPAAKIAPRMGGDAGRGSGRRHPRAGPTEGRRMRETEP